MEESLKVPSQHWTKIIQPHPKCFDVRLNELWQYRELILLFVWRDFVKIYKQTILGPLWFFLQPLFTTIVFTVIFGRIAKISTDGVPHILFYMAGTILWTYFASCLTKTSETFIANSAIFGKVYFPRLTVPASIAISSLIAFSLQFLFFILLVLFYALSKATVKPTGWLLYTPFLIIHMAALSLGAGIIISSMTTKYRDLKLLANFGIQLWMYATPVVYPISIVPIRWRWLMALNPMTTVVETFRYAFLGSGSMNVQYLVISVLLTIAILFTGLILFSRIEKNFIDTV
ncbi:ABC transporter permease [candidate division KSB3 bacterium]|uniref:Transport permease protein n=1 Tax=candidate division KSB3 bacterium TaxID=2044937 RepID=A0A2G6E6X7_9BACT|nr:MAG: ABC transporter permease [candidate division KSB3 bacterium]PIE30265.1 MAG: ABC transporter permease [candidate division KSB3 bacterium]